VASAPMARLVPARQALVAALITVRAPMAHAATAPLVLALAAPTALLAPSVYAGTALDAPLRLTVKTVGVSLPAAAQHSTWISLL